MFNKNPQLPSRGSVRGIAVLPTATGLTVELSSLAVSISVLSSLCTRGVRVCGVS